MGLRGHLQFMLVNSVMLPRISLPPPLPDCPLTPIPGITLPHKSDIQGPNAVSKEPKWNRQYIIHFPSFPITVSSTNQVPNKYKQTWTRTRKLDRGRGVHKLSVMGEFWWESNPTVIIFHLSAMGTGASQPLWILNYLLSKMGLLSCIWISWSSIEKICIAVFWKL